MSLGFTSASELVSLIKRDCPVVDFEYLETDRKLEGTRISDNVLHTRIPDTPVLVLWQYIKLVDSQAFWLMNYGQYPDINARRLYYIEFLRCKASLV